MKCKIELTLIFFTKIVQNQVKIKCLRKILKSDQITKLKLQKSKLFCVYF